MASSRASATRALKHFAATSRQTRQLHITAPANLPVRIASASKPQPQLDESARAFSTSDSSYDSPNALRPSAPVERFTIPPAPTPTPFSPTNHGRHFNTSRELKRVGDSSTIDFAYLPPYPELPSDNPNYEMNVPLVPWNITPRHPDVGASVVADMTGDDMPSISTAAAESTHISTPSAMADVHDGGGNTLDFTEVAETLTAAARKVTLGTERESGDEVRRAKGLLKQVWTGMLDDVFGQKTQKS